MFGALMFATRVAMQGLPNIHLLGLFTASLTLTYRKRALIPLYIYIFIEGVYGSYGTMWFSYLYAWLPLWGMFMLAGEPPLGNESRRRRKALLYMLLCGFHGLSFGVLCAPVNALFFGLKSFEGAVAWVIAGLPYDFIHAISNFAMGGLIIPLSALIKKLNKNGLSI